MTDHNLAYLDREFLESEEARSIRILAEYFEPLRRFKSQKIQDTVVFFGSARIKGRAHAEAALARLQRRASRTASHQAALKKARRAVASSKFYEDARQLARLLTTWTMTLDSPN